MPKTSNRGCPVCGSRLRLLPMLYGDPTPEAIEAANRGELVIGGCIPGGPSRVCAVCEEPQEEPRLPPMDPDWPWDTDSADASHALGARHAKSRLAAGVWGHLVGDAIGVPYEGSAPDPDRTVEVRGDGVHEQPPGTWSDDGALMLALLDSLASVGFDPTDQAKRALAWADEGRYAPGGIAFGIGGATFAALERLRRGTPAIDAGGTGERDQGNGSLMRILPVALADLPSDDAELVERAHLASRVTHGHPNCQVACALCVLIARELRAGTDDPEALLGSSVERLRTVYAGRPEFASVLDALVAHRSNVGKPGGGWVLDSFWSAWEAFAAAGSYREAIERAIRYGHDTDTTAAIAGGLAGLHWGLEERHGGIPFKWLSALRGKEIVEPILARLLSQR